MRETEKPALIEKGVWWAKVGGIVAAVLGMLRHAADLALGGAAVAAAAFGIEQTIVRRKSAHSQA